MGMAFVMALVLLVANVGVTSMAAEPDDVPMQGVPDEDMEIADDDGDSDLDDGVDDAKAVIEESENAYPAEGQDDEENAGAVGGEASDTDDGSAAPEEEP
ncbi:MAG: hypothetical protein IJU93_04000, partial [Lachnospiraceae bacterium]|nr:hypothetical protein [Lachnospiraceae bacterium]